MKTRSSYKSLLAVPSGDVVRSDFSRLFLTRGTRYEDGKMDSLGIDRIANGGFTLSYDKGGWLFEIHEFVSELLFPVIEAGYDEEEIIVEAVRKGYKYSVSVVMFRGIVERKLFLLGEYNSAGDFERVFMHNGLMSMMN